MYLPVRITKRQKSQNNICIYFLMERKKTCSLSLLFATNTQGFLSMLTGSIFLASRGA